MKLLTLTLSALLTLTCSLEGIHPNTDFKDYTFEILGALPDEVIETSGIIFFKGLLWTINDSDNEEILYGIDTTDFSVKSSVSLKGAVNIDWEAITQDETAIYIGDIGNNHKSRTSYTILKLDKNLVTTDSIQVLSTFDSISFSLSEGDLAGINQTIESIDAEAMLSDGSKVFVYQKDWDFAYTTSFICTPDKPVADIKVGGRYMLPYAVTDATFVDDDKIAFIGYKDYRTYFTLIRANADLQGDVETIESFEILELIGRQTEGLTYENGVFYISAEGNEFAPSLFRLRLK